jgi:hypothetical protein
MAKAKKDDVVEIVVETMAVMEAQVWVIGTSPLLMNRLAEKARQELLLPAPKKNAAEKASNLKHRPYDEFLSSTYRTASEDGPTRLVFPGGGFRKAIAAAALDVPGSSKAQIGRLVKVSQYNVDIYGVPRISSMIVRQAGMNKTPDVRTRAILPQWCCELTVQFASPILKERAVFSLLNCAGAFIGVGDGRNEKGSSLSCGSFRIALAEDMEAVERIVEEGGRARQDAALESPDFYDDETRELLEWFDLEVERRGDRSHVSRFAGREAAMA